MAFVEMRIKSVVVAVGPMPSLVVLQPAVPDNSLPTNLPIQIGGYEATAISLGAQQGATPRPVTHDLLLSVVEKLDAHVVEVRITKVHGTTFFAQLGIEAGDASIRYVDARPSDAIALAVRTGVPIFADYDVLLTASLPDFSSVENTQREQDMASFHSFVEELSPEDFKTE